MSFQPFGDFLRANAHWHALVLEGGFTPDGRFLFLPIHDTQKLTEAFRRALIKLLLSKCLISEDFSTTLLCWKNSGFSVNHQVRIPGDDHKTRVALAQYIARAPLSSAKLSYLPAEATVRYCSDFNPAIGDSTKVWNVRDFIAAATLFTPPQGVRLIRFYGLYSSRSRWRWPQWEYLARHAPQGWKTTHGVSDAEPSPQPSSPSVPQSSCRSAWARLIAKVYEIDLIGGSWLRSKQREPPALSPLLVPNAHSRRHHRPGGGEQDPPPSGEDRSSASRPESRVAELTLLSRSSVLEALGRGLLCYPPQTTERA